MSKTDISGTRTAASNKSQPDADARLTTYLRDQGLRKTPERFAILHEALSMKSHFSISDLQEAMDKSGYHVSRATVYNTVEILCKSGILTRHLLDSEHAIYECQTGNHLHLVCARCGKIKEVSHPELSRLLITMKYPAFKATYFSATLFGYCSACIRKEKKETTTRTRRRAKPKKEL